MERLDKIFTVTYGVNLELYKLNLDNGINSINYVSRTKKNNGISARVERIEGLIPNPANTLSIALTGSVLEVFLQEEEYYSGRDIAYLTPIKPMDRYTMLMYCTIIRANQFKYCQGRGANNTVGSILIPDLDEIKKYKRVEKLPDVSSIPDYFLNEGYEKACWYMDNINQYKFEEKYRPEFCKKELSLNVSEWKEFVIGRLFNVNRGKRLKSVDRIPGDIAYYSASIENNGLTDRISNPLFTEENSIIYSTFGDSYYVDGVFTSSDEISILKNNNVNKYIAFFIITIMYQNKFRYTFGRKAFKEKLENDIIKLPIQRDEKGDPIIDENKTYSEAGYIPDWGYMEEYIKSLPYSKRI